MRRDRLVKLLSNNVANVTFTKKFDGSRRKLRCTLDRSRLPKKFAEKLDSMEMTPGILTAYDVENKGWRSFYLNSIQKVERIEEVA